MKEFFSDLMYHCSANNTKSRGFYIFITAFMALLALGSVASWIVCVVMLIKGWFQFYYLLLALISTGALAGIVVWLIKS